VSNYIAAQELAHQRMRDGMPISNRLIREVHAKLLSGGRGATKSPGEFRKSQNWIGGTRPGTATFVPPPPMRVEPCMAELEIFIHGHDPDSVLIRTALAHIQFETIHPFLDGNGRTGRLLITLMLVDADLLRQPLLYLSLHFKQHRPEYYRLLGSIRRTGDWEAWVEFFLEGVRATAADAEQNVHRILRLFRVDAERVRTDVRGSKTMAVYDALRQRPMATITSIAERAGVTFPTARDALARFVEAGIVREITGQKRNRVFVYDRYLSILSEGLEPL
jgi:Fic family protein